MIFALTSPPVGVSLPMMDLTDTVVKADQQSAEEYIYKKYPSEFLYTPNFDKNYWKRYRN
jgi:hypothetical protein